MSDCQEYNKKNLMGRGLTMGAINDIFTTFGPEYLDRYGDGMPDNHKKAIRDIVSCRTETQGMAVYQCLECNTFIKLIQSIQ